MSVFNERVANEPIARACPPGSDMSRLLKVSHQWSPITIEGFHRITAVRDGGIALAKFSRHLCYSDCRCRERFPLAGIVAFC